MFLFLADLHALTSLSSGEHDSESLHTMSSEILSAYVALGIDLEKVVVYRQADFPQITELAWIFSCLVKHQFLTIGHAYKDAMQNNVQPGLGVFLYPILMAADILITGAKVVPVGEDQVQHIEMAREIARKFNTITGTQYFEEPEARVLQSFSVIQGTDGRKMSKSYGNSIPIFASREDISKCIMSITTDSTPKGEPINPESCTVCGYLALLLPREQYEAVADKCLSGSITYKELKEELVEAHLTYFKEAHERYYADGKDRDAHIESMLSKNRKEVGELFSNRLKEIRSLLGI